MMDSFAVISFKESEEFYILQAEFIIFWLINLLFKTTRTEKFFPKSEETPLKYIVLFVYMYETYNK